MSFRSLLWLPRRGMLIWRRANKGETVPTKTDPTLKKSTEFKVNSPAEFAYTQVMEYPATYKPHTFNFTYHGGHFLAMTLITLTYAIWRYNKLYLKKNGLKQRPEAVYQQ